MIVASVPAQVHVDVGSVSEAQHLQLDRQLKFSLTSRLKTVLPRNLYQRRFQIQIYRIKLMRRASLKFTRFLFVDTLFIACYARHANSH